MRFDQVAFGCRLKEIRKERGLTQEQLAAVVNMSTVHHTSLMWLSESY
mgnify:CR=1 FL=1